MLLNIYIYIYIGAIYIDDYTSNQHIRMILKEIICNCKSAFPSQGETKISKYLKIETVLFLLFFYH